jgi:antitoxin ParD1/3/4
MPSKSAEARRGDSELCRLRGIGPCRSGCSRRGAGDSSATLFVMSSELESVNIPAELLDEARDAVSRGAVGSVADYVADAVRLRLAKERALAQVTTLFGGPPPEDVVATVRQRAGLPPRRAAS